MAYEVKELLESSKVFYRMSSEQEYNASQIDKSNSSGYNGNAQSKLPGFKLTRYTQDDFIKELMPESHRINDIYARPNTPITKSGEYPKGAINRTDVVDWKIRARVSIPKQNTIADKQRSHLIGNDLDLDIIKGSEEDFREFFKFYKYSHIHHGMSQVVLSALTTGDGAIYFYIDENDDLKYDVWSYKYGNDVSYHPKSLNNEECITRHYTSNEKDLKGELIQYEICEVYDKTRIHKYKLIKDDWELISSPMVHGFSQIPVAYNKLDDVAWGKGQGLIDKIESSLSDLRESNEYFQFQILFLSGRIKVLPNASKQGKVLAGDANSKVESIEPQSKPESFVLEVNTLTEEVNNGCGVVVVDPETLKGDSSGAYVKSVYFPATAYAMNQIPNWSKFFTTCVSISKEAVGKILGKQSSFVSMKVSWNLKPFVPQNELEMSMINMNAIQSGSRSKQTGASLLSGNAPNEYELIQKEEQFEYERTFNNPLDNNL